MYTAETRARISESALGRLWVSVLVLQFWMLIPCTSSGQAMGPSTPGAVDQSWLPVIEGSIAELPRFSNARTSVIFPQKLPKWPNCSQPRAIPGTGSSSTGRFPISLRCDSPRWMGQLVVQVEATKRHLVAARNLQAGTVVGETDFSESESDWTKVPDDVALDGEQLVGRTLVRGIQQGQTFTLNFVRQTAVIKSGERVRVQMAGTNFTVTGDGVASQQGAIGESIRIKMVGGQFVTAVVLKPGVVELKLD